MAKKNSLLSAEINGETIKAAIEYLRTKKTSKQEADSDVVTVDPIEDFKPRVPEVDLVPANVRESYAAQDTKKRLSYVGSGILATFGILYGVTMFSQNFYEEEIAKISTQTSSHRSQLQKLQPYLDYRNAVEVKRSELNKVTTGYLDLGRVTEEFNKAVSASGYNLSAMAVSGSASGEAESANCANPDPFTASSGVACLTFTLKGEGNLSNLYNALSTGDNGFLNVFVPTVTKGKDATLDGSVAVDTTYNFGRYNYLSTTLEEKLAAEAAPIYDEVDPELLDEPPPEPTSSNPAPAPTPTPTSTEGG